MRWLLCKLGLHRWVEYGPLWALQRGCKHCPKRQWWDAGQMPFSWGSLGRWRG